LLFSFWEFHHSAKLIQLFSRSNKYSIVGFFKNGVGFNLKSIFVDFFIWLWVKIPIYGFKTLDRNFCQKSRLSTCPLQNNSLGVCVNKLKLTKCHFVSKFQYLESISEVCRNFWQRFAPIKVHCTLLKAP